MSKEFVYNSIRKGVAKDNQIVLEGFCKRDMLEGKKLEVYLEDKKLQTIKHEVIFSEVERVVDSFGLTKLRKIYPNIDSKISVVFAMPDKLDNNSRIYVAVLDAKNEDVGKKIYECSGRLINNCLSQIICKLESVASKGSKMFVTGYAIDKEKIEVEVASSLEANGNLEYNISWSKREDIIDLFPEAKADGEYGFSIEYNSKGFSSMICFSARGTKTIKRVKAPHKMYGNKVLYKLSRYWYKGKYNIKHYGVGETFKKVRKRFSKLENENVDYTKWLEITEKKRLSYVNRELIEHNRKNGNKGKIIPSFSLVVEHIKADAFYKEKYLEMLEKQKDSSSSSYKKRGEKADYYVFCRDIDHLKEKAIESIVLAVKENVPDVIYCDSDEYIFDDKVYANPNLKPDYNEDLLRCSNYIGRILAISSSFANKIKETIGEINTIDAGSYDTILKCVEQAERILHIPEVLYSMGVKKDEEFQPKKICNALKADYSKFCVESHFKRIGVDAKVSPSVIEGINEVTYSLSTEPKISIIIPNKDHVEELCRCIDSIDLISDYRNYEIIIVENNSVEEKTFAYYRTLVERDDIRLICWQDGFNYSAINNCGASCATGDYLLLLNNDTEIINRDCIRQLLGSAMREEAGVVGAKLFYEDDTIQHAGIVLGLGGIAGNAFAGVDEAKGSYQNRTFEDSCYSAVTGACMMVKKEIFEEVQGLNEELQVAFNDVDFCLKVKMLGKKNIYKANAMLHHYESKSRGSEDTFEKQDRFNDEIELFAETWRTELDKTDIYYNKGLSLKKTDFSLALK